MLNTKEKLFLLNMRNVVRTLNIIPLLQAVPLSPYDRLGF